MLLQPMPHDLGDRQKPDGVHGHTGIPLDPPQLGLDVVFRNGEPEAHAIHTVYLPFFCE
ncbi:hypothetical protein [uncultured Desulfovibrio sp.]|uniref:hypothetical protein n=1 Tax=uncultured Desulfovibrio sp. TaxID=167968 RepID=UPI002605A2D0|nr:hypothetical protein [uncultured Desulfovibrio sp.]